MRSTGQGIGRSVVSALPVNDAVLKAKQLSENLLLPRRVQSLLSELNQTFMIGHDVKLGMLQVTSPLVDCHEDCQIFFLVS
jgi:hypothetical protein